MEDFLIMYDEHIEVPSRFIGFIGRSRQFDFILLYSDHFFGKTLVIHMQSQKSVVLTQEEAEDVDFLRDAFSLQQEEAEDVSAFLPQYLSETMR